MRWQEVFEKQMASFPVEGAGHFGGIKLLRLFTLRPLCRVKREHEYGEHDDGDYNST